MFPDTSDVLISWPFLGGSCSHLADMYRVAPIQQMRWSTLDPPEKQHRYSVYLYVHVQAWAWVCTCAGLGVHTNRHRCPACAGMGVGVCMYRRGCGYKQAWVCACMCSSGCGCALVQARVWVCTCAGLNVGVHMCLLHGASWRFRTEGNLVPRVQAEMSCCLSSGTKAGTHCCPNSRASRMNTLLSGTWALVKFRFFSSWDETQPQWWEWETGLSSAGGS